MSAASSRIAKGLAKGLGIKLEHDVPYEDLDLTKKDLEPYSERDPTPTEWVKDVLPNGSHVVNYLYNSFPFLQWIGRYNRQYLAGDIVAGITVGAVLVPESMAYARLAGLPSQFGLYSAFVGPLTYWIFGTSKDIAVGPIAVMSAITGNIVAQMAHSHPEIPGHVIASALTLVAGGIVTGLGILRLGFLVDLIPLPSIYAFMTGASISITTGQLPSLLGIPHRPSRNHEPFVNTGDPTYLVFIDVLRRLPEARLDAALGITALTTLYAIRYIATKASHKFPSQCKVLFFINTLRITFVILVYTMVSWLVNKNDQDDPKFAIVGHVPRGFQDLGVPVINSTIIKSFANKLPVAVIIILLEHIASAKSFGRINNYTIKPSQELLASGSANIIGTFFGAFIVTGSFARTAISSKAGIRTPMAGIIVALIILLAIYVLTPVFFHFPVSVLSAILIHAVLDLIILPEESYRIWRISPIDFIIFITGVILSIFTTLEIGIYVTVSVSAGIVGFRLMRSPGRFLGKVTALSTTEQSLNFKRYHSSSSSSLTGIIRVQEADNEEVDQLLERNLFLPLCHEDGTNPEINIEIPLPGIFIYRFTESFNYTNASYTLDQLLQTVYSHTQRTNSNSYKRPGDRPWNAPSNKSSTDISPEKSHLKSIILDFSAVNHVDSTSISNLHDLRNQLDHYASPDNVSWHFANINNRWTKKALTAAGFGYDRNKGFGAEEEAYRERGLRPIYNITNVEEDDLLGRETYIDVGKSLTREIEAVVEEKVRDSAVSSVENEGDEVQDGDASALDASITTIDTVMAEQIKFRKGSHEGLKKKTVKKRLMISGTERPFFHVDLTSALNSAVAEVRYKTRKADIHGRDTGVLP